MIIAFVLEGLIHAVNSLTVPYAGLSDTEITGMNHLLPRGRKTKFPLVIKKAFSEQDQGTPPFTEPLPASFPAANHPALDSSRQST